MALRDTGPVLSSRSDQSAISQQLTGRKTQASWGHGQSVVAIRLRFMIKVQDEVLHRKCIADDEYITCLSLCMQPQLS